MNSHIEKDTVEKYRTFIGIKLSEQALAFLETFRLQHTKTPWAKQIRWTKEANIHITVRFLGDLAAEQIAQIKTGLSALLEKHTAFEVTMTAPKPFPSLKKARMLASLIHKNSILEKLAHDIENIAVEAGVAPEERLFKGHITVGRFRNRAKGLDELLAITNTITTQVDNVVFFKSDLKPTGAEYTEITRFALQAKK